MGHVKRRRLLRSSKPLSEHHLHIVSFDVPAPPNYGGVIDVYYKVKALSELGVKVHLHCFQYGRPKAKELDRLCHSVNYYPRKQGKLQLFNSLPYVVVGRRSEILMDRLLKDDHPILFEGLHCCFHLGDPRLNGRLRLVRAHNVEHDYYAALAKAESNTFRRGYFINEARKLQRFEPVLSEAHRILAISPKDQQYFDAHFHNVVHIPAFHAVDKVAVPDGLGDYAFYHGALGVAENDQAALFLVRKVFKDLSVKLVIAGSDASLELKREVARMPNGDPSLGARSTGERAAHLSGHGHQTEAVALPIHRSPRGLQYAHGGRYRPEGTVPRTRRSRKYAREHQGLHERTRERLRL